MHIDGIDKAVQKINLDFAVGNGQILKGKVVNIISDDKVEIIVGQRQLTATVNTRLEWGRDYLFQVKQHKEPPVLQVLNNGADQDNSTQFEVRQMMNILKLKDDPVIEMLIKSLIKADIPITRDLLLSAKHLLAQSHSLESGIKTVEWMVRHRLPLEKDFFQSVESLFQEEHLSTHANRLLHQMMPMPNRTNAMMALARFLHSLPAANHESSNWLDMLVNKIGFQHENLLSSFASNNKGNNQLNETLKSLVLKLIQDTETPSQLKPAAEMMLKSITGQQLQMVSNDETLVQLLMQLPIRSKDKFDNVSIYWEGKRSRSGQIDSGNCQIFCRLDLNQLNEMLVHIRIQKKNMTIKIHNNYTGLGTALRKWEDLLRMRLEEAGFRLVSLSQVQLEEGKRDDILTDMIIDKSHLDVKI
ncbi:hypothetical protein JOD45_000533 [Scopulibacillus daqui]|uniref:Flagellar hook-length control protein FliK n=2 Tax=Scopulibacillus daqui TaxID=1469162 RepID=A0ABS2PXN3_9BACL|nr:hypothetical protein [Scopulibacillus daqui]